MLTPLIDQLEKITRERKRAWGFQVAVVVDGEVVLNEAGGQDGLGQVMRTDSLTTMYCSAKSILVALVGRLVTDGELSFDDRVGDLVDTCSDSVATCTVEEMLSHRSGIVRPSLIEATTEPPTRRLELAVSCIRRPLAPSESCYTEAAEWLVIGACAEAASGMSLAQLVPEKVVGPLGLGHEFELQGPPSGRRRIGLSLRKTGSMPLLLEKADCFNYFDNPGYGGFGTMVGQAMLLDAIRSSADGKRTSLGVAPEVALELINPGPRRWDHTFERACSFGRGFMTRLSTHNFGPNVSETSFAQAGLTGMTTVVSDPTTGATMAIHLNGMLDSNVDVTRERSVLFGAR